MKKIFQKHIRVRLAFVLTALAFNLLQLADAQLFSNTGPLNTARYWHSGIRLTNGKVLVAGGYNSGSIIVSSAELYDPSTGVWTNTGAMNTARNDFTATLLPDGKVLVVGGNSPSGYLSSAELYNPITGTWTTTGAMHTVRVFHTAALLPNGKVLVVGGQDGGIHDIASSELYDPATGVWTLTGALNVARQRHTETLLANGKVLVAAGSTISGYLRSAELYDPLTGIWTLTGAVNANHSFHTATMLSDGKVLVTGGYSVNGIISDTELFNPVTGAWTLIMGMSTKRAVHNATLLPNGKVIVLGGITPTGDTSSAELFDPIAGTWTAAAQMNNARDNFTATLLSNGKLLIAGGYSNGSVLSNAELFEDNSGSLMSGLNNSLVAYFPFNGNANDLSGKNNHGTVHGAILTTNRFGIPNSAYSFDGATSYIEVPDSDSLDLTNEFTLSFWINARSLGSSRMILCKHTAGPADQGTWTIQLPYNASGSISFQASPYFDPYTTSSAAPSLDQWHHVVFTYSRSSQVWQFYVDGNFDSSGTRNYDIKKSNPNLIIGAESHPAFSPPFHTYFDGIIDDIRIYNRALSAGEVQALYSEGNDFSNTTASISHPTQISALPCPSPSDNVDSLILITHGVEPAYDLGGKYIFGDISWITTMSNAVRTVAPSNWEVRTLDWTAVSQVAEPTAASIAGTIGGHLYGNQLAQQRYWKHVHLIAHSAGSSVIEAIASELKASSTPPLVIHETFLDPFTGYFHEWRNDFGSHSDWSDNYFAANDFSLWTNVKLPHARNVDVSWLDTGHIFYVTNYGSPSGMADTTPATIYEQQIPIGIQAYVFSSHGWPHDFYQASIPNSVPNAAGYGFPLSEENGWNNFASYSVNNDPVVLNGQLANYQNLIPIKTAPQIPLNLLPNTSSGVNFSGDNGATLFNILSPSSFSPNDAKRVHANAGGASTNVPAWLSVGLTITNPMNFIQFDAAFIDNNLAQGLLTVYWDTNQIGMVDERVASTNSQTYRLALPRTVTNSFYVLGFRLDSFENTLSSIAITNVANGFVGVDQPIALGVALFTNGTPVLQVTGASNYNYLVESSTNLLDWTPTALLVNSNGTVFFADPTAKDSSRKFYRAVMPQ